MNEANQALAMRGSFAEVEWPAIFTGRSAMLAGLIAQFDRTPSLSIEQLQAGQRRQLTALASHAWRHSANFRLRLERAGLAAADLGQPGGLATLPVLTRQEVQSCGEQMYCTEVPPAHLPLSETGTSGSLGQPVLVQRTALTQLLWEAFTLREHLWHGRDFRGTLAVIRANLPPEGVDLPDWGPPVNLLYNSGPAHGLNSNRPISEQIEWLARIKPQYLLTYPTNLSALLDEYEANSSALPGMKQIRTIGETVTPALRARTERILKAPIADTYSSQELGIMAIQDSTGGQYHVMAEGYIVEVLDDDGQPCAPGEVGRLIVTDLHNYAMPLVRYDTGDYAEIGAPRGAYGLPTLTRIMGRARNMIVIDGSRRWPTLNAYRYREIAPINQYQLVQHTPQEIEVRLVCETPLTAQQQAQLTEVIHETLEYEFDLRFSYFEDHIPLGRTGKFEEFVCLVD